MMHSRSAGIKEVAECKRENVLVKFHEKTRSRYLNLQSINTEG
jgi:hypothetical protein